MTRDDIIRMARQADRGFEGGPDADGTLADSLIGLDAIERFAALVEAEAVRKERDALQTENEKLREQLPNAFREGFYRGFQAAFEDAVKEAALQKEET